MLFLNKPKLFATFKVCAKSFLATIKRNFKITLIGASGGIGQQLALLLCMNRYVSALSLYDINPNVHGIALDLTHVNSPVKLDSYSTLEHLGNALRGSHIVVIVAGNPRTPGMSRDNLFICNAGLLFTFACNISRFNPSALICLVTNPLNAAVPLFSEVMARFGAYNPKKIFGITSLDLVRASTFSSAICCTDPTTQFVPVIGGHEGKTIVPLLSQACPSLYMSDATRNELINEIRIAGDEVTGAKGVSATLSTAHATERFVKNLLKGLAGEANVVDYAYVRSCVTCSPYFSSSLLLGPRGVEEHLGYGVVDEFEEEMIDEAIPILKNSVAIACQYVGMRKINE